MCGVEFGEEIRRLREKRGLSLRRFSDMVGISSSYMSQIERGTSEPPLDSVVIRMASLLCEDDVYLRMVAGRFPRGKSEAYYRLMADAHRDVSGRCFAEKGGKVKMKMAEKKERVVKWLEGHHVTGAATPERPCPDKEWYSPSEIGDAVIPHSESTSGSSVASPVCKSLVRDGKLERNKAGKYRLIPRRMVGSDRCAP